VALKVVSTGHWTTQARLKRFRLEAETAASLDNPNIVPIYEVGQEDGRHFFAMKFVEGGGTLITEGATSTILPAYNLTSDAGDAEGYADCFLENGEHHGTYDIYGRAALIESPSAVQILSVLRRVLTRRIAAATEGVLP